jgi:hypothetical protein
MDAEVLPRAKGDFRAAMTHIDFDRPVDFSLR